jgi:hypothetical protein
MVYLMVPQWQWRSYVASTPFGSVQKGAGLASVEEAIVVLFWWTDFEND